VNLVLQEKEEGEATLGSSGEKRLFFRKEKEMDRDIFLKENSMKTYNANSQTCAS
jgi:hypothetical protein